MTTFENILSERKHFPAAEGRTYLLSAATGLVPDYVRDAYARYQNDRFFKGGDSAWGEKNMGTGSMLIWAREMIGKMINSDGKNIAFGDNSSRMLNIFVNGITLKKTDNVILAEDTFISSHMAWKEKQKREGFELRVLPAVCGEVSAERIISAADENTKVICLCHVENNTGYRHDLIKIGKYCRENDILLLVDGMQAMGALTVDVKKMNIDFLIGGDYKWMAGFCGTGYAYISDRCLSVIRQQGAGWFSAKEKFASHEGEIPLSDGADRFEYGYPNAPGIYSLGLVAERYCKLGSENIEEYILSLADKLRENVKKSSKMRLQYDFERKNCSQIVKIVLGNVGEDFGKYLEENNVFVNTSYEGDCCIIRAAVHYYNNESDIMRFCEVAEGY